MIRGKGSQFGKSDKYLFVELRPVDNKKAYKEVLNHLNSKANHLRSEIRKIWSGASEDDNMDNIQKLMDEIQVLNDRLYELNVFRAEFEWKRNML